MKGLAKYAVASSVFTLAYFGPWMPRDLEEITGFFRKRSAVELNPNKRVSGDLLVVIPARTIEPNQSITDVMQTLSERAKEPSKVKVVVVHENPSALLSAAEFLEKSVAFKMVQVVQARQGGGRGPTQNLGAKTSDSELLLFCHADTMVPINYDELIRQALVDDSILMCAFSLGLDEESTTLEFVANSANLRSRFWWMPYGDQTLSFRTTFFLNEMGGFREDYKIMEDFELVQRVRSRALKSHNEKIHIFKDPVVSSARRWREKGAVKATFLNWAFCAAYVYLGLSPDEIFNLYYR